MKVWLFSTHAAEEFNLVRMWLNQKIEVTGVFDCYSPQRPKIRGITDVASIPGQHCIVEGKKEEWSGCEEKTAEWSDLVVKDRNLKTNRQEMDDLGIDFYVLMESTDRAERAEHYAKMGLPVAIECFGQESVECDAKLVPMLKKYPRIYLIPYAQSIVDRYLALGVPIQQIHLIRFGLFINDYQRTPHPPQKGNKLCRLPFWFCAHNSVHKRGKGCGWIELAEIMRILPFYVFCGKDTDEIGGLGEVSWNALRMLYRRCTVYLSMGTIPAPYTLTPVEAMASSAPIVFFDNKCNLMKEEWAQFLASGGGLISDDTQQIAEYMGKLMDGVIDPSPLADMSFAVAVQYFDAVKNGRLWKEFFESESK